MSRAFSELAAQGRLHHGTGTHEYGNFAIWL